MVRVIIRLCFTLLAHRLSTSDFTFLSLNVEKIIYQGVIEKRGYYRRNFLPRLFIIYGHHHNFRVEYYLPGGDVLKGMYVCTHKNEYERVFH